MSSQLRDNQPDWICDPNADRLFIYPIHIPKAAEDMATSNKISFPRISDSLEMFLRHMQNP